MCRNISSPCPYSTEEMDTNKRLRFSEPFEVPSRIELLYTVLQTVA